VRRSSLSRWKMRSRKRVRRWNSMMEELAVRA
jgi:hypothetical protein